MGLHWVASAGVGLFGMLVTSKTDTGWSIDAVYWHDKIDEPVLDHFSLPEYSVEELQEKLILVLGTFSTNLGSDEYTVGYYDVQSDDPEDYEPAADLMVDLAKIAKERYGNG